VNLETPDSRAELVALLPDLRGYARFLAGRSVEADDLVQEALARALAALGQLRPGSNLRAWSFVILRNVFFEQTRRRRTERAALERGALAHETAAPAQHAHSELADLQRCIFTLPPLQREALVLVGAQGMSYEEAAEICGVPAGTVKARVSRARAALARAMPGPTAAHEG
jgi:RNA polymerase sigma-70 factor (ECF subfamily)